MGPPSLPGESEKGPRGQVRGEPGMSCCCTLLPWLQASWGPLGLRRWFLCGRKRGENRGKGMVGCAPRRRARAGSFVFRVFISFSKASFQARPRGRVQQNMHQLSRWTPPGRGPLQAVGPTNWSVQGRGRQSSQLVLELSHSGGLPVVSREVPLCLLYVAGPVFSSLPQFPLPPVLSQRKLLLKGSCSPEVD